MALIEPLLPPRKKGRGRPRVRDRREIVNAIFYLVRSGCAWRLLPHDFPPFPTVYWYFRCWQADGTWKRVHDALLQTIRVQAGKQPEPSAAVIDSQSVKTTVKGGRPAPSGTTPARKPRAESDIFW